MDEPTPGALTDLVRRAVDDLEVGEPRIEEVLRRGKARRRVARIRVGVIGSLCLVALTASLAGLSGLWERGSGPQPAHVPTPSPVQTPILDPKAAATYEVARLIRLLTPPGNVAETQPNSIETDFPFQIPHGPYVVDTPASWAIERAPGHIVTWFLAHGGPGIRVVGHGSNVNGRTTYLAYRDPPTWAYRAAGVSIYVEPTAFGKSSLVSALARARWIPLSPASVRVPKDVSSVWVLAYRDTPSNVVAAHRMDERGAGDLETYLNGLQVDGRSSPGCPADTGLRIRIRFGAESAAPSFTAWPDCAEVVVTKNGEMQSILRMKGHLLALLIHYGLNLAG